MIKQKCVYCTNKTRSIRWNICKPCYLKKYGHARPNDRAVNDFLKSRKFN